MSTYTPETASAVTTTTSATAATNTITMIATAFYSLSATTAAIWYAQGTAPTAAAGGAGSCFLAAGASVILDGKRGAKCSVVQDAAAGKAVLVRLNRF